MRLWDLSNKLCLMTYKGVQPFWAVEFSPLGNYFVTGSSDSTACIWRTDHVHPLRILSGHLSDVNCVKFHPNCNYVLTGSSYYNIYFPKFLF